MSNSNYKNKARKLRKRDKQKIEKLLEDKTCINCGSNLGNKPRSAFKLAPVHEMVVINCDKCENGKFKVIKDIVNQLGIEYELEED
jgi:RNase P subunit RPR2